MELEITVGPDRFAVVIDDPAELGIPLDFAGDQARAFYLEPARAVAVEAEGFVGDRRRGGSANCETLTVTPHGNGTHTECVGHITMDRHYLVDIETPPLLPAVLITVTAANLSSTDDTYRGNSSPDDEVICEEALQRALDALEPLDRRFTTAVVLRLSNRSPVLRDHSGTNPVYLTDQASRWLRDRGCDHLLVELPSVDREDDGGGLSSHHTFFGATPDEPPDGAARSRTITEMIAVPRSASDGPYALALQVPRLHTDAAPTRPVLYALRRLP